MNWFGLALAVLGKLPVEKWLIKPRDNTKALEQLAQQFKSLSLGATKTITTSAESQQGAPSTEKMAVTISQGRPEGPTDIETKLELKRRLGKELYKTELDLSAKLRIANKPCFCLEEKHTLGLEALAEELIAQEPENTVYSEITAWVRQNQGKVTAEAVETRLYDDQYPKMAAEFRDFRKRVMGTSKISALVEPKEQISLDEAKKLAAEEAVRKVVEKWPNNPSSNPPAVRLVGVSPRLPTPEEALEREEEKLERRRRGLKPGAHIRAPLEWEQIERIQEFKAEGLTFRQIAERMKLPFSTAYKAYVRGRPPLKRAITPERLKEVVDLRRQRLTLEEIGRRIGKTKMHVHYLLHRAGERIDPVKAAEDLNKEMLVATEILRTPDTIPQLAEAADKLQEVTEDAALLLEITPHIPMIPEYFPSHPYQLGFRAAFAEEVLRTGAWCLEQKQKSYEIRDVPAAGRLRELKVEHTPEHKELLKTCGESAREAALGYLENKPGYETKAAQHMAIVEEMMEEVKE